eukprot:713171_1
MEVAMNIPAPIKMRTELDIMMASTINIPNLFMEKLEKIHTPKYSNNTPKHNNTPTSKNITMTLNQFRLQKYNKYSNIVINGYIRNLQKQIPFIIPSDINNICLSFYLEKENKYILLHMNYTN